MSKKFNSVISILLGVALVIAAVALKKAMGTYFLLPLFIGIAIAVFSIAEFAGLVKKTDRKREKAPEEEISEPAKPLPEYRRKSVMMTRAEAGAFMLLKELFGDKYEVFAQIPLVAVIDKLTQNSYRNELFRVADFLIADKITFAPLILIELDDSSHLRADRLERDKKVREICSRAGLPIVGFTPAEFRVAGYVRSTIKKNMLKK